MIADGIFILLNLFKDMRINAVVARRKMLIDDSISETTATMYDNVVLPQLWPFISYTYL